MSKYRNCKADTMHSAVPVSTLNLFDKMNNTLNSRQRQLWPLTGTASPLLAGLDKSRMSEMEWNE